MDTKCPKFGTKCPKFGTQTFYRRRT